MTDTIYRFSTKSDIKNIVYSIDPVYEKTHNREIYLIWYYGREILPGHVNFEYTKGTNQMYLIPTYYRNNEFRELCDQFPGFRDLYMDTLRRYDLLN